jgi:hypothetical protein
VCCSKTVQRWSRDEDYVGDPTDRILLDQRLVERHRGENEVTEDVVFSLG